MMRVRAKGQSLLSLRNLSKSLWKIRYLVRLNQKSLCKVRNLVGLMLKWFTPRVRGWGYTITVYVFTGRQGRNFDIFADKVKWQLADIKFPTCLEWLLTFKLRSIILHGCVGFKKLKSHSNVPLSPLFTKVFAFNALWRKWRNEEKYWKLLTR